MPRWPVRIVIFFPAFLITGLIALLAFSGGRPLKPTSRQEAPLARSALRKPARAVRDRPLQGPGPAEAQDPIDKIKVEPRIDVPPLQPQPLPELVPSVQPSPTVNPKPEPEASIPVPGVVLKEIAPGYETRRINGFIMLLSTQAIAEGTKANGAPFAALTTEFDGLVDVLPPKVLKALRRVRIWIEWDNLDRSSPNVLAKYYASGIWWLGDENPLKANAVEVLSLKRLAQWKQHAVDRTQLVLLHELAHAVHRVFLPDGFRNVGVKYAYRQAMDRRLYERVQDERGGVGRAYAATNAAEYFAELTCSYLDRGKYFPFTREELKEHDPTGYRLMQGVWGQR